MAATLVPFKNDRTGELKHVKVGWSWILFLWSGLMGIPLFVRRLYFLGIVFFFIWVANIVAASVAEEDPVFLVIVGTVHFVLQSFLGFKGNEITAKNYLRRGWSFADPHNETAKYARTKWRLLAT